jgi:trans-aconitate 2-methyltransferase
MAHDWNAALYRRFEDERTRPALDLLARVGADAAGTVVDLGCGPGNSTELLVQRWPAAETIGVDTSPAMIEAARERLPAVRFVLGDAASWAADRPCDVIFANALLQWIPDHARLYPRLVEMLASGGWLAVQVPDNHGEPSHASMREVAVALGRADVVAGAESERAPIGTFDDHWRWLAPICRRVDLWRTEYVHPLDGGDAIIEWLRATGLRPYLARLATAEQAEFLARYRDRLAAAYPAHPGGKVLLRFPRLFVVAQR